MIQMSTGLKQVTWSQVSILKNIITQHAKHNVVVLINYHVNINLNICLWVWGKGFIFIYCLASLIIHWQITETFDLKLLTFQYLIIHIHVNPSGHQMSSPLNVPSWSYGWKIKFLPNFSDIWPLTLGKFVQKLISGSTPHIVSLGHVLTIST